ncbi:MAG: hypothetical protein QOF14_3667 [Hyphomicrobiales bacterium]|jgi:hypothetical protein|nr:hypothetical protein [Hyphomicrobiales bacterium]
MALAHGTLIATPQGGVQIERLAKGDVALFGSAAGSGLPHATWGPRPVEFSAGTPPGSPSQAIYLQFGATQRLICTFDQVLLQDDGRLSLASELTPEGGLVDGQGQRVSIQEVSVGLFSGGVHHIASSMKFDPSIDGHLLIAGGIVAGDYTLQLEFSRLDPSKKAARQAPRLSGIAGAVRRLFGRWRSIRADHQA